MNRALIVSLLSCVVVAHANGVATGKTTVILAIGAAGEEEFGKAFTEWAGVWSNACVRADARLITIGGSDEKTSEPVADATNAPTDLTLLHEVLTCESQVSSDELWLVLIGHGTFDGRDAKFNLRGPDLSATNLAQWLKPMKRPYAVINCASSSSPFLKQLSAPDRVIITATRSGYEQNYARFGKYLADAIGNLTADLDKDGQTSLLEAFIMASRQTSEFYETEGRLATEHALLDDNGDGLGTPADWFRGVRAVKKSEGGGLADGLRAHQFHLIRSERERNMPPEIRERRDEIERAVGRLRGEKTDLAEDEYYRRLETLMLELAKLYEQISRSPQIESATQSPNSNSRK